MPAGTLVIGTRGSQLALAQAEQVAQVLASGLGVKTDLEIIATRGDDDSRPIPEIGVTGLFTRELEEALREHRLDAAVHSYKDVPLRTAPELIIAAITRREDPSEMLIYRPEAGGEPAGNRLPLPLKKGAVVGTGSARRQAQLLAVRPDLRPINLRGNVTTRLNKLADGLCDAVLVASAGVRRLGLDLSDFGFLSLPPTKFIPAPGQGALALQMRRDDHRLGEIYRLLNDAPTAKLTALERGVLAGFGGGCNLPLGAFARTSGENWELRAFWGGNPDNPVWGEVVGTPR